MEIIIECVSGNKYRASFKTVEDYTTFLTLNQSKIKNIYESEQLPYNDTEVTVAKPTQSSGWEEVNINKTQSQSPKAKATDSDLPHFEYKEDDEEGKDPELAEEPKEPKEEKEDKKVVDEGCKAKEDDVEEEVNNEDDGEVDEKTGKTKLMELDKDID